jgi:hypothetical protein
LKSDNIFRFVALRAPQSGELVASIGGDEGTKKSVGDEIERLMNERRISLQQARLLVGSQIVKGEHYFRSLAETEVLVLEVKAIRKILESQKTAPDFSTLKEELKKVLKISDTLTSFLKSDQFKRLKESLWFSFYALTLNPDEWPQDREIVSDWLRVFYLAEAPNEATYTKRAKSIERLRPSVPFSWFKTVVEEEQVSPTSSEPMASPPFKTMADRIEGLKSIRSQVHNLFLSKIQKYKSISIEEPPPKDLEGLHSSSITVNLSEHDPARISETDLSTHHVIFEKLRKEGLELETLRLPEVIGKLDSEVARMSAELYKLSNKEEVMLTGKSFVQVKRTISNLYYTKKQPEMDIS